MFFSIGRRGRRLGAPGTDQGLAPLSSGGSSEIPSHGAATQHFHLAERDIALHEKMEALLPRISTDVVVMVEPESPFAEAMRSLRLEVILRTSLVGGKGLVLPVISTNRLDGRSFIAANLAAVFAHAGANTLLIDADLRHPSQHSIFRMDGLQGLSDCLAGASTLDTIRPVAGLPTLSVLPAGTIASGSHNVLNSEHLDFLLSAVYAAYDVVIIDTPAMFAATDALLISSKCKVALMVARYGVSNTEKLFRLSEHLNSVGVALIGTVINRY